MRFRADTVQTVVLKKYTKPIVLIIDEWLLFKRLLNSYCYINYCIDYCSIDKTQIKKRVNEKKNIRR